MKPPQMGSDKFSPGQRMNSGISFPDAGQPLFPGRAGRKPGWKIFRASARLALLRQDRASCVRWILRLLVGGAFVLAGGLKIADPATFADNVGNYRVVPREWINLTAILMPWIEMVAGSFVLAGVWLKASALVIASLTAMFFVLIVSSLVRGLNIECGCFGTIGGKHIGMVNLAIDTALFLLAASLAKRSESGARANDGLVP